MGRAGVSPVSSQTVSRTVVSFSQDSFIMPAMPIRAAAAPTKIFRYIVLDTLQSEIGVSP